MNAAHSFCSLRLVQHGRVFTASPTLANPYTIQLERYCENILFRHAKSGNVRLLARAFHPLV